MASDAARGRALLVLVALFWLYYTAWTLLLPLFDEDSAVHRYFPAREWAIRIPASILITGISAVGFFTAKMMLGGQLSRRKHGVVDCNQSHHSN